MTRLGVDSVSGGHARRWSHRSADLRLSRLAVEDIWFLAVRKCGILASAGARSHFLAREE